MKCTLSQAKAAKIQKLTEQNQDLQAQVESLLQKSTNASEQLLACCSLEKSLEAQIQAERVRASLLATSIATLSVQRIESQRQVEIQQAELAVQQQSSKQHNKKLWQLAKKVEEDDTNRSRLKEELKMYANMSKSGNTIIKKCENLKKTQECLARTLAILKNKLESHRKYLAILHKQQSKQQQIQQKPKSAKNKPSTKLKTHGRLGSFNEENEEKNQVEVKKLQPGKIKQFDNINRRRNMMLMTKSKGSIN